MEEVFTELKALDVDKLHKNKIFLYLAGRLTCIAENPDTWDVDCYPSDPAADPYKTYIFDTTFKA